MQQGTLTSPTHSPGGNPTLCSQPTVQLNMKVSPKQVGGAAVNCPATSPEEKWSYINPIAHQLVFSIQCQVQNIAYKTIMTGLL